MSEGELNFFGPSSDVEKSGESSSSCVGDIQRVITGHAEASKIGQQIADEEIRFVNGLAGSSSTDSSCNTSPLSALLQSTTGNNSPLASLNTPSQSPVEASGGHLIGDFAVSTTMAEEEQSSIMSDTSNIVNYSTPSPSMSSRCQFCQPCFQRLYKKLNQFTYKISYVKRSSFLCSRSNIMKLTLVCFFRLTTGK